MSSDPLAWRFLLEQIELRGMPARNFKQVAGDGTMLLCMLAEDGPPCVPSHAGVCSHCGADIYWSKGSPRCDLRLCARCASVALAKGMARGEKPEFALTEAVAREVSAVLGPHDVLGPILGKRR
jgi:hypothetical protein